MRLYCISISSLNTSLVRSSFLLHVFTCSAVYPAVMLPKAPPAVPVLALAGKAASDGRAPLMPGKVVVLAGASMSARLRHVVAAAAGRREGFSGEDFNPKVPLDDRLIKKLAKETSLLLQDVGAPEGCPFQDLACFAVEMGGLREVCCDMVGTGGGYDPDGAISTLLGVQARVRLLLSSRRGDDIDVPGSTESLEAFLLSSTHETKMCIAQYTATQGAAAEGDADADFSGENPKPKVTCAQLIEKLAKETSSLLRDVRAPKGCTSRDRISFFMELCDLHGACHKMNHVGRGGLDEDAAISKLIGVQARIRFVLSIPGGHEFPGSLEGLLLSSLHETEMIIKQYITAQQDAAAAGGDDNAGKATERDDGGARKTAGRDVGGAEKAEEGEDGDAK